MQPATPAQASTASATNPTQPRAPQRAETQVKETLISLIIAFALAFVVRAFVIEAFVIPTGSMAPTLMGAHMRFTSPSTGYAWANGPHSEFMGPDPSGMGNGLPHAIQGNPNSPLVVHDPLTTQELQFPQGIKILGGDRILVFKYLYSIYDPKRFDVVVFKNPADPSVNFIKRLIGLPGEQLALIDGDVFTRVPVANEDKPANGNWWSLPGWTIQRKTKSERVQRTAWQMVYDTQHAPLSTVTTDKGAAFRSPWVAPANPQDWTIAQQRTLTYAGAGGTTLAWDHRTRPINDVYPYNEGTMGAGRSFPVSDVRSLIVMTPGGSSEAGIMAVLRTRQHEFRATIAGSSVTIAMGRVPEGGGDPATWTTLGQGTLAEALAPGKPASIDFWHVDQSVTLRINDRVVAEGAYDWTPEERVRYTFGKSLAQLIDQDRPAGVTLSDPSNYPVATFEWRFSGGPFSLARAAMWRDLHYQSSGQNINGKPPRGTHPISTSILSPDHFFVCGDNSPASSDARLWTTIDPWVAAEVDPTLGVVARDLMIGKAFFVYFPSLIKNERSPVPIPDFGRMRFIW